MPALIIGATGVVGSLAARNLRTLYPELPLAIASRTMEKSQTLAAELGRATAVEVDVSRSDLGFVESDEFSLVAIFMKDDTLNSLTFAQDRQIPYMDVSSAAFEIGPLVAQFIQRPTASAILMNSNWLAGTSTNVTMHFAKGYKRIDNITVSALLDTNDIGGAAADADYERQTNAVTSALVQQAGSWKWLDDTKIASTFTDSEGVQHPAQAFSNLDVLSLASATHTRDMRFEFAVGETAGSSQDGHFTHEIIVTISGTKNNGQSGTFRYEIIHPEGQAPMTAVSAVLGIEALLGLVNPQPKPGLYFPNTIIDSDHAVTRLRQFGAKINEIESTV